MKDTDRPPRLIIDVTARSTQVDTRRLFDAVRVAFVERHLLEPALLLLTDVQYEDLPRSFDQHKGWLRVEVIAATEAAARLGDPTCAGALVASFRRHSPPERWLAMDFDLKAGRLLFEPPDGLERFARDGSLPLPVVVHELATLVGAVPLPIFDPDSVGPLKQRQLMVELGSEARAEQVAPDPAERLAMARALGVAATVTPRDRVEAELRSAASALGATHIETMPAEKLEALLARARRRPQPPTIIRVGDLIEVVNPGKDQRGLDHPRVRVHRIAAPVPAIARLRAAVSRWTLGDFEADPFLEELISRLVLEGGERLAFLHARAVLLQRQISPQPGRIVDDWRSALERLLARDVPPATLRLWPDRSRDFVTVAPPEWVETAARGLSERDASIFRHPRPALVGAVPIEREWNAAIATEVPSNYGQRVATGIRILERESVSPVEADERWGESFEDWTAGREARGATYLPALTSEPIKSLPWEEADRHVGLLWLALREAARAVPAVRLHDGRALVPVSAGVVARVDVRETAESLDPQALLDVAFGKLVVGVNSGIPNVELSIPRRIIFLGERLRAEVELLGSALFLGTGAHMAVTAAELHRQKVEEEERAARERDDD